MITSSPFKLVEIFSEDQAWTSAADSVRLWGMPIHFVSLTGCGMAPIYRITEKMPRLHGRVDRGYRLQERRMNLILYAEANDAQHLAGLLDRIAYAFSPTYAPLRLRVTRADGKVRQIDCFLDGELDFPHSERNGNGAKVIVPLLAPDPTWYDMEGYSGAVPGIFTAPLTDGANTVAINVADTTFESWPVIHLRGPYDAGITIESDLSSEVITIQQAEDSASSFMVNLWPAYKNAYRGVSTLLQMDKVQYTHINAFTEFRVPSQAEVRRILSNPTATSFNFTITAAGTGAQSLVKVYAYRRFLSL